ncbi:cysteine desulfurase family protein [Xanthovirga aplysinae]|uniref:cysteine desulfurase family protein n=1 Tax=Xanthovirga aplysinae TaxID=2529853 RepID=UPI0012BC741E|nr:cysteine desulfurase family protein [Xanthovirga aplysinae]MTI33041.1 cysteine desulfurase [Xanthovirga aplysinae]
MRRVYFDNAATTPIDPDVFEAMKPFMLDHFGNPSSTHSHGRAVRSAIERARKTVAGLLNAATSEIFFTSGGTEADNAAIRCTIEAYNLKHAITTGIEHKAVLQTLKELEAKGKIKLSLLDLDERGNFDISQLDELLKNNSRSLVSIMHGNNEIGNIFDIEQIAELCEEHGAIYHSDTVQTMGHYQHDLKVLKAKCIVGSAHKFHGPKGIGFLYASKSHHIHPFVTGGGQERNMRGGTENVYGIVGLAKALEIAYQEMDAHHQHIQGLKDRMVEQLRAKISGVEFNGNSVQADKSLYTVLNVSLPPSEDNDMLLFNLDINGISASGGSACNSGASLGSHVLSAINADPQRGAVRFSFSKYNTVEEVDYTVAKLSELYGVTA